MQSDYMFFITWMISSIRSSHKTRYSNHVTNSWCSTPYEVPAQYFGEFPCFRYCSYCITLHGCSTTTVLCIEHCKGELLIDGQGPNKAYGRTYPMEYSGMLLKHVISWHQPCKEI